MTNERYQQFGIFTIDFQEGIVSVEHETGGEIIISPSMFNYGEGKDKNLAVYMCRMFETAYRTGRRDIRKELDKVINGR